MAEALSDSALDQVFRTARSYNGWLDRDVSDEQIRAIYELMKMGPTSANQQPARIVWCKSGKAKQRLAQHAGEKNRHKILTAPVCAIVAMDLEFHEQLPWLFPHTDARSWFAGEDKLAARALGLDCGPMSGFDNAAVDAEFFAGEPNWRSNFICSIGYGDPASIFGRSPRPDFDTFNRIL